MIYLILFFALILRLISLNQSLWLDEATSALVSKMSLRDMFTKFLPGDFHPPLYYLILKYWVSVFGNSEIALRIPSVIFGLGAVYVVYQIGKIIFNEKTGHIAGAFLATSGLSVYYSQEARMYSLAAFLVSLSVYLFIKKKWILFSTVLLLVGMTDYVSLFILPVFLLIEPKNWRKMALSFLALVIGFAIWLPVFSRQLAGGLSVQGTNWWNILGTTSFKNIALIPTKFVIGRISFENHLVYGVVLLFVFLIFGYLLLKSIGKSKLIWYWLIVPTIIGTIVSFKIPTLSYFRFLFCLPAFYLLIANGTQKVTKYKTFLLVLAFSVNLISTGYYLANSKFHREDWRAAANAVGNDPVVFPDNSHEEAFIYYGKLGQIEDISNVELTQNVIWLSRYVQEITDPSDSTRIKIENLGYHKSGEYNFNDVVFWKYVKNRYAYEYIIRK